MHNTKSYFYIFILLYDNKKHDIIVDNFSDFDFLCHLHIN